VANRLSQLRELAAQNQGIPAEDVDMTNIHAFYLLDGGYIDTTRETILREYGSIKGYVTKGLGLKESEVVRLRRRLLE
jgi:hypothetical protein